jgi:hypothetical protein
MCRFWLPSSHRFTPSGQFRGRPKKGRRRYARPTCRDFDPLPLADPMSRSMVSVVARPTQRHQVVQVMPPSSSYGHDVMHRVRGCATHLAPGVLTQHLSSRLSPRLVVSSFRRRRAPCPMVGTQAPTFNSINTPGILTQPLTHMVSTAALHIYSTDMSYSAPAGH